MPQINYAGQSVDCAHRESVLDALLRAGTDVPFSCKAGACQSCLLQAVDAEPPEQAQRGLKPGLRRQGLFLACQWRPDADITVALPGEETTSVPMTLAALDPLNASVLRLRLAPARPFDCVPGQHVALINSAGTIRSYSIANLPAQEGSLELHVRLVPGGSMSEWLRTAQPGATVRVRGPAGSCCYDAEVQRDRALLLAGTGTGLAPLRGIVLDALAHGHAAPIMLVHGALQAPDLYYVDELTTLAAANRNFTYVPCVLNGPPPQHGVFGDIQAVTLDALANMQAPCVYLCGAPDFVVPAKKKLFLAGVALGDIFSDAFLPTRS